MRTAEIVESYFEYRASVLPPMFAAWTLPNALVEALYPVLKQWQVGLGDISWNKETTSFQDLQLTINVTKLRALLKIGLESVSCVALNPDWSEAVVLVGMFQTALGTIFKAAKTEISSHEDVLSMHITPGPKSFKSTLSTFVNEKVLGAAQMFGVSVYHEDSSIVLDKSVKYDEALFVRIYRKLPLGLDFMGAAKYLYDDEVRVLKLIGMDELIEVEPES